MVPCSAALPLGCRTEHVVNGLVSISSQNSTIKQYGRHYLSPVLDFDVPVAWYFRELSFQQRRSELTRAEVSQSKRRANGGWVRWSGMAHGAWAMSWIGNAHGAWSTAPVPIHFPWNYSLHFHIVGFIRTHPRNYSLLFPWSKKQTKTVYDVNMTVLSRVSTIIAFC